MLIMGPKFSSSGVLGLYIENGNKLKDLNLGQVHGAVAAAFKAKRIRAVELFFEQPGKIIKAHRPQRFNKYKISFVVFRVDAYAAADVPVL